MNTKSNSDAKKSKTQNNEHLYETIFNEATDAIFIGDKSGNLIKTNKAAEHLTGYSQEELIRMNMYDLFEKTVLDRKPLNYADVLSGKTVVSQRILKRKDSSTAFIEMKSRMLSNGNLISFFTDITAEKKLKKTEMKYEEIIENVKEGIVIIQDATLIFANSITAQMLGYPVEKIVGEPFLNFVFPDDRDMIKKNHMARLKNDNSVLKSYDFRLLTKTGKACWVETNPILIQYEGAPAVQAFLIDIDERKRIQVELEKSEKRFRDLVENMKEGLVTINLDSQILYASPGLVKIMGYSEKELIGKNFLQFVLEKDLEYAKEQFGKVIKKNPEHTELRVKTKNGNIIWLKISGKPIIKNSSVTGMSAVIIDIDSRKKVEERLKNSETMYRNLIDNSPIGIFIHQNGRIIYINSALKRIAGYSSSYNFTGKDLFQFIPKEYHEMISERVKHIIETKGRSELAETKVISQSGKLVDVLFLGQYVEIDEIPNVQVYVYDVTEFNQYKTDVDKLTRAVEQSSSAIFINNYFGIVEFVNRAFVKLTGFTFTEIKDKKTNIFKLLNINSEDTEVISKSVTKGEPWLGELSIKTKSGEIIQVHSAISPILNREGKITSFVAIAEDLTAQKEFEKNLTIAKIRAEKSDKLKSDFLAQMSHEIRTPINAIVSFTGLLRSELYDLLDEDQRISFEMIERAGDRIIRTIELLLNYSELKTETYEPIYSRIEIGSEILSKYALKYRHLAKTKNIKFNVKIEAEDTFFYGDRHALDQIFSNLIDNAVKYTEAGSVEVKLFNNEDGKLAAIIKDTGKGISKNYIGDIFNPFSQEEVGYTRSFEGNGLGLALVKEYCEMNSIKIKVESTKDIGTIFTLIF